LRQLLVAEPLRARLVCGVKFEKDIAERDRLVAELDEDGREESTSILLFGVLEVEKEIAQVS
jgi:hypothetical protein